MGIKMKHPMLRAQCPTQAGASAAFERDWVGSSGDSGALGVPKCKLCHWPGVDLWSAVGVEISPVTTHSLAYTL